jgi:hypothetical protein
MCEGGAGGQGENKNKKHLGAGKLSWWKSKPVCMYVNVNFIPTKSAIVDQFLQKMKK